MEGQRVAIKPKEIAEVLKEGGENSSLKNNSNFNIQKWVVFLCISNEQSENKIKKIISVTIAPIRKKYLKINLGRCKTCTLETTKHCWRN